MTSDTLIPAFCEPLPEPALLGQMPKRLNQLIDANLRDTYGQ